MSEKYLLELVKVEAGLEFDAVKIFTGGQSR